MPDDGEPIVTNAGTPQKQGFLFSDNFKWLMGTIAIPLSTFLFGYWQDRAAQTAAEAQQRIGDARDNVGALTALLPALADSEPKKAKLAFIVLGELEAAQHGSDARLAAVVEAMRKVIDGLQNSSDPADQQQASDLLEAYSSAAGDKPAPAQAQTTPVATARVNQASTDKPRIVYLQIFGNGQRAAAENVQSLLRGNGVGAPGIEDVSGKLAGRMSQSPAQIRYFSEVDLGRARWLASFLEREAQGPRWTVVRTRAQGVPEGQLELWWPYPPPG